MRFQCLYSAVTANSKLVYYIKNKTSDFMLAVMTLSAVKWSYFCIEYCTDVSRGIFG